MKLSTITQRSCQRCITLPTTLQSSRTGPMKAGADVTPPPSHQHITVTIEQSSDRVGRLRKALQKGPDAATVNDIE